MAYLCARHIINKLFSFNAVALAMIISPNLPGWTAQSDLQYYENMRHNYSVKYSIVPVQLSIALNDAEYMAMLKKITIETQFSKKWILLQEINIENALYCVYFINFEKVVHEGFITISACLTEPKAIYSQYSNPASKYAELERYAFNDDLPELIDVSNYSADGTMIYLTISNNRKLKRLAVYNISNDHTRDAVVKIVSFIKNTTKP